MVAKHRPVTAVKAVVRGRKMRQSFTMLEGKLSWSVARLQNSCSLGFFASQYHHNNTSKMTNPLATAKKMV